MGVLPLRVRELAEGIRDALLKSSPGLSILSRDTRVGAAEALGGRHVEEKGQIRNEAGRCHTVRGAYLGLEVRDQRSGTHKWTEKSIDQNHLCPRRGR